MEEKKDRFLLKVLLITGGILVSFILLGMIGNAISNPYEPPVYPIPTPEPYPLPEPMPMPIDPLVEPR